MKEIDDMRDDQIRIVGSMTYSRSCRTSGRSHVLVRKWVIIAIVAAVAVIGLIVAALLWHEARTEQEPSFFEPTTGIAPETTQAVHPLRLGKDVDSLATGFTELRDTTINDIPLRIYIPHNAELSLHIGRLHKDYDKRIIYAAQAADVRADNGGIVGAFVLHGVPKAWGLSKKGFCASIDGKITIGVAENSPLFEEATEKGGYFFRQYPLVDNGELAENEVKGKSIRRSICDRNGEIIMVETLSKESFHDFAQALVDLGVQQAVYLVGSNAYGWAVDENGKYHEFGDENLYCGRHRLPRNTSYVVWHRK